MSALKDELSKAGIKIINEVTADIMLKAMNMYEQQHSIDYIMKEVEDLIPGGLAAKFGGKKAAAKMFTKACGKIAAKGATKLGIKFFSKAAAKIGGKVGGKLMTKVTAKITPKLVAKFGLGFIPLVSAGFGAWVNGCWFLPSFAEAARKYYLMEARYY